MVTSELHHIIITQGQEVNSHQVSGFDTTQGSTSAKRKEKEDFRNNFLASGYLGSKVRSGRSSFKFADTVGIL
jgi:hypothetical protein